MKIQTKQEKIDVKERKYTEKEEKKENGSKKEQTQVNEYNWKQRAEIARKQKKKGRKGR